MAHIGRIFMKFDMTILENMSRRFKLIKIWRIFMKFDVTIFRQYVEKIRGASKSGGFS